MNFLSFSGRSTITLNRYIHIAHKIILGRHENLTKTTVRRLPVPRCGPVAYLDVGPGLARRSELARAREAALLAVGRAVRRVVGRAAPRRRRVRVAHLHHLHLGGLLGRQLGGRLGDRHCRPARGGATTTARRRRRRLRFHGLCAATRAPLGKGVHDKITTYSNSSIVEVEVSTVILTAQKKIS